MQRLQLRELENNANKGAISQSQGRDLLNKAARRDEERGVSKMLLSTLSIPLAVFSQHICASILSRPMV